MAKKGIGHLLVSSRCWIGFMFLGMKSPFSGWRPIDVLIKATRLDHLPI
jgi:hypothetical protein